MAQDARSGGQVTGPGTWNSDNVDIKASPGEEVIPGAVVAYYGQKFFNDLIQNAVAKTGEPRGSNQAGQPPSPAARASFAQDQGGNAGGGPTGSGAEAGDDGQPEASNPAPSVQGQPLRAAGPTMGGQNMAEGGVVAGQPQASFGGRTLDQHSDAELPHLARSMRNTGNLAGHRAVLAEINRRTNPARIAAVAHSSDPALRKRAVIAENAEGGNHGGKPAMAMGGVIRPRVGPERVPVGRRQGGGTGISSVAVASPTAASRFNGPSGGSGGIRVPPVHVASAPLNPKPVISAPAAAKPIAMPSFAAVEGAGPPVAASPAAAPIVQRSTAPRIGNLGAFAHAPGAAIPAAPVPTQSRSPLAMIGRGR